MIIGLTIHLDFLSNQRNNLTMFSHPYLSSTLAVSGGLLLFDPD